MVGLDTEKIINEFGLIKADGDPRSATTTPFRRDKQGKKKDWLITYKLIHV